MSQSAVLAKCLFDEDQPSEETLGQAVWLYQDLIQNIALAVQAGIVKAFSKS